MARFVSGQVVVVPFPFTSFALPHRVVTAHESCVRRTVGKLVLAKLNEIRERVCAVICQG